MKSYELDPITPMRSSLTNTEHDARKDEIDMCRTNIVAALGDSITTLIKQGSTTDVMIHEGYVVHGFLRRPEDSTKIVHIELNPNSPRSNTAKVRITEKDNQKLQKIREAGLISTGAEETAVTRYILPNEADRKRANSECLILVTADAITGLLEQVLEKLDIEADEQQLNKARGFKRIRKLFSR
jgi:hypothetical protein